MSSGGSNQQQQQQQQQQQNQQQQQLYYYGTIPSSNSRHSRESATSNSLNVPVEEVRVRTRTINTETQPLLLGGGILGSQASTATTVIFDDVSSVQHDSDIETNNPGQQQQHSRYNYKKKARINKNKYVEANDDQRSLLRYMDEVIELSKKKSTTTTTRNNNKNNGTRNNESSSSGNSGSGSGGSGGIYAEIPSITLAEIKEASSMLIRRSSSSSCCCGRCMSSFCALQVPFVTFVATISIAIGIIYLLDRKFLDDIIVQLLPSTLTNNIEDFKESIHELETSYYEPFMLFVLPALTLVLGMVGAITPISTMLFASFSENLCYHTNPDVIKQATLDSVEHVIINVAGHIDKVNIRLSLILDDMKPMCQKSVQYINKLLALDPNLLEQATIPSNPTTFILVKERLCDSKDELRQCVLQFEQEIDSSSEDDNNNNDDNNIVKSWIPSHLHSSEVYRHSATCQTMTVLFVLQCLGIVGTFFLLSLYLPFDDDDYDATQEMIDGSITTSLTSIGALLSINLDSVSTAIHNYVPLTNNLTIVTYTWILIYALVSYLITMVVILVVKITGQTSHKKMLRIVNDVRSKASQQTNLLLKQYGIIFLCQDILQTRVERAKLKLLKLIHTQLKLEMLWSIIDQQQQFEAAAASSSNSNINNTSSSIWRTPISPKKPTTTTSSLSPKRSSTAATTTTTTYTGDSIADRFSKIKSYWRPPQQQHDQETTTSSNQNTTTTTTMMAASGVHQPPPVSPTRNHPTTTTTGTTMTSGGGSSHSPPPPVSPTRNLLSSYWPSKSQQQQQQQQQQQHSQHDDAADEEQHSAASSSSKLQRRTSTHDEEMATGTEKPTVPRR